ncbi:MAG: hypothetical protein AB7D41_04595 [Arcobacter sp.]|uniref:hypothetical protein n=1 Tax=Arcobacter sp. TaxID=1872629 RepID=UPI003CFF6D84
MYLLNDTPVFLEFLKRFFKFAKIEFKNRKIQNKLFIYSKCNCGQKDCARVYLKSNRPFKEKVQGTRFVITNKGLFTIDILADGFFNFEVFDNEKIPYKKEIDKYFKNKKVIQDIVPIKRKKLKKLTLKDKQLLHRYFRDLKLEKLNCIEIDE